MNFISQGRLGAATGLELPDPAIILEALTRFVNPDIIGSVLKQTGRQSQRIRQLPAAAVVWLVIGIGIWADLDVPAIWRQVVGTLHCKRSISSRAAQIPNADARKPGFTNRLSSAGYSLRVTGYRLLITLVAAEGRAKKLRP